MAIVNLTRADIIVISNANVETNGTQFTIDPYKADVICVIPKSGMYADVKMNNSPETLIDSVPVHKVTLGQVTGLPKPRQGTWYIVSNVTLQAAAKLERYDLLGVGGIVRNKNNTNEIIGCLFLQKA